MNLLQMVQFVQGNVGTSADLPFAGPSTIVGTTGQYLEFVNYVQQAYKAIQVAQELWRWRIKPMQLTLLAGQSFYTVAQIQAQISDYEDMVHMHFPDDTRYGLIAQNQASPSNTVTVGSVTSSVDTIYVTVSAVGSYAPLQKVFVNGGGNTLTGPIQSVNGSVLGFAVEQVTIVGTATSIAAGSTVSYAGTFAPGNIGNQTFCFFIEYQNWRGWKDRNVLPVGKPTFYTKTPDGSLEFNPVPDATTAPYVFYNDYRMAVDVLAQSSDSSTPATLPARYHEAICWKAVIYWAMARSKGDKYESAKMEFDRVMNKLEIEQLPDVEVYLRELYG